MARTERTAMIKPIWNKMMATHSEAKGFAPVLGNPPPEVSELSLGIGSSVGIGVTVDGGAPLLEVMSTVGWAKPWGDVTGAEPALH